MNTHVIKQRFAGIGGYLALLLSAAHAHHAMEYIALESYNTAAAGEKIIYVHYDYMVEDDDQPKLDHWEITPGMAYGITDRLMVDIHTHYAKFGEGLVEDRQEEFSPDGPSPFFEAVAMSVLYRLTEEGPFHAAVNGSLEIPFSRAKDVLGRDDPVYGGTFIFGRDFGTHGNVMVNIGYEKEGDEDEWSWGVGAKTPISADPHGIAGGIEVMGDFDGARWSVLPGVYVPIKETIQFKIGFEIGQQKDEEDDWVNTSRFSTAMMFRF